MIETLDTPHQAVLRLLTGHFRETSGYRAIRRNGVGDWLLIQTVGGRGRFGYPGGELFAEPGDWVLIRPGTPHDYGVEPSLERWELVWAHFQPRPDWLEWLAWPSVADGLLKLHIEDGGPLGQQFLAVHHLLNGDHRRRDALAMNALEALLLGCDAYNEQDTTRGDARILRALEHIDRNLTEKLLIDDIAQVVGLSPSRLAHLFRAETGQTIQAHIEARRMQLATDLLRRTSFPIKQISAHCGFESPFYFSQRFRRFVGLSPLQYRMRPPA